MSNYTKEPWTFEDDYYQGSVGDCIIVKAPDRDTIAVLHEGQEANAARLVACVNACEGINPEVMPDLLACCEAYIETNERAKQEYWSGYYQEIGERLEAIKAAIAKTREALA